MLVVLVVLVARMPEVLPGPDRLLHRFTFLVRRRQDIFQQSTVGA